MGTGDATPLPYMVNELGWRGGTSLGFRIIS